MIIRCSDAMCGVRDTCAMWEPGPGAHTLKQGPYCKHLPCAHYDGPPRCQDCGALIGAGADGATGQAPCTNPECTATLWHGVCGLLAE